MELRRSKPTTEALVPGDPGVGSYYPDRWRQRSLPWENPPAQRIDHPTSLPGN